MLILFIGLFILPAILCAPNPHITRYNSDAFKDSLSPKSALVPYNFMFNHDDGLGTMQHREENKNEDGVIRGSYGYRDPSGIYRHVSYIADARGFHAVLRTNEPGVENKNSADVAVVVQPQSMRLEPSVPMVFGKMK